MAKTRILILGGTTEARQLAERLAGRDDLDVTLSLAGRTQSPIALPVPVRVGGFGGAEGLAKFLREATVHVLVDATHPYAAQISRNAADAAVRSGVAIVALRRPPWQPSPGDRWDHVADAGEAIDMLGATPKRVFIALGRQELAPLATAPRHHYWVRSVDPVEPPLALPHVTYIVARGPFDEADEFALLGGNGIEFIIAKNSGGVATAAKLSAARQLGIRVLLIHRPTLPEVPSASTVNDALAMIDHLAGSA